MLLQFHMQVPIYVTSSLLAGGAFSLWLIWLNEPTTKNVAPPPTHTLRSKQSPHLILHPQHLVDTQKNIK